MADVSSSGRPVIVWFRDDLRLADNPALAAAAATGRPVLCIYVHDETNADARPLGGAAKWWLHGSLAALDEALRARSGELAILRGPARACIETLVMEIGASHVFWNRRYDAAGRAVDTEIKATLKARDIVAESFNGHLLHEPWTVMNQSGAPFRVFTAFWRAACAQGAPATPLPVPSKLRFHATPPGLPRVALDDLGLEPRSPDWAGGMRAAWQRGEAGAAARLAAFVAVGLEGYADARDRPDKPATSRLSPYLRFGNVSVRQVWHAVTAAEAAGRARSRDCEKFRAELGWREFSYNLLYHQPELATRNVRTEFDAMPWRNDPAALAAWQRGLTGYPIVDAGMRELWTTGWMHNRVRMVVASFLTKHLLIDWRAGEAWFWDTLVDADTASNAQNWQWVAGSGADAAPYFRIFNPVLQGEKFDPDGDYVRRWVPELAHRTADVIHHPVDGGVDGYPQPIVDHAAARKRALDASKTLKRS